MYYALHDRRHFQLVNQEGMPEMEDVVEDNHWVVDSVEVEEEEGDQDKVPMVTEVREEEVKEVSVSLPAL